MRILPILASLMLLSSQPFHVASRIPKAKTASD
jgi:hypothetical protein